MHLSSKVLNLKNSSNLSVYKLCWRFLRFFSLYTSLYLEPNNFLKIHVFFSSFFTYMLDTYDIMVTCELLRKKNKVFGGNITRRHERNTERGFITFIKYIKIKYHHDVKINESTKRME